MSHLEQTWDRLRANPKQYLYETIQFSDDANSVRELIRDNPSLIDARYSGNHTPLLAAFYRGRLNIVETLLAAGANINFIEAIVLCRLDLLRAMLVQNRSLIFKRSSDGWTPLHQAVRHSTAEIVAALIAAGANVNAAGVRGITPLFHALHQPQEVAELLLANGARVNAAMKHGFRPLHWAAMSGNLSAVQLLVANGANVDLQTDGRQTAWSLSIREGHRDVTTYLTSLWKP